MFLEAARGSVRFLWRSSLPVGCLGRHPVRVSVFCFAEIGVYFNAREHADRLGHDGPQVRHSEPLAPMPAQVLLY